MKRPFEVYEDMVKLQKLYYLYALLFASIFAGLAIALALILPSENAGIWKLVLPAALGAGGIGSQFLTVYRSMHESGPLQDLREQYRQLASELPPVSANVHLKPRDEKAYRKLFEGFTECDFIAYCAPFRMESRTKRKRKESLKVHLKRYKEGVNSRYLFYDKDSYELAVNFFKDLQKQVTLAGKIELRCLPEQSSPAYTYFGGTRGKKEDPRCILYPSVALKQGLPDAVIVIDGDHHLLGILSDHFDREWDSVGNSMRSVCWKP